MDYLKLFENIDFDDWDFEEQDPDIDIIRELVDNKRRIKVYKKDWNRFVDLLRDNNITKWVNNNEIKYSSYVDCIKELREDVFDYYDNRQSDTEYFETSYVDNAVKEEYELDYIYIMLYKYFMRKNKDTNPIRIVYEFQNKRPGIFNPKKDSILFEDLDLFNDEDFEWIEDQEEEIDTERVYSVIKDVLLDFGVKITEDNKNTNLHKLGLDDLDLVEFIMNVENYLDIPIPDDKIGSLFFENLESSNSFNYYVSLCKDILSKRINEDVEFDDDEWDFIEDEPDNSKDNLYVMRLLLLRDNRYEIIINKLLNPVETTRRRYDYHRYYGNDPRRKQKEPKEEIIPNTYTYNEEGTGYKWTIDVTKIKKGVCKLHKGVVVFEENREREAKKALGKSMGSTKGGLTRKINKRQQELEEFTRLKNSLDELFERRYIRTFEEIDIDWDEEKFEEEEDSEEEVLNYDELSIGDRVVCDFVGRGCMDRIGTIISFDKQLGVEFDDFIDGHDCQGKCKDGYGWFVVLGYKYNIRKIV